MSLQLGKIRKGYDARLRPDSIRYAAWCSLTESGKVYAKGALFPKNGDEKSRFEDLIEVEEIERDLDDVRRDIEKDFPVDSKVEGRYASALLWQASLVQDQLTILRDTDGRIVLAYGCYVKAEHSRRIKALKECLASIGKDLQPYFKQPQDLTT